MDAPAHRRTAGRCGHLRLPRRHLASSFSFRSTGSSRPRSSRPAKSWSRRRPSCPATRHSTTIGVALAGDFRSYLVNSLIAAGGATALGFLLSVPGGLGLCQVRLSAARARCLSFTVVTRVFPPIALALPFFLQFRALGLIDNPFGLIIAYLPIVLPLMIWILTGFFRDFPNELVDAARIDGLGTLGILVRIVVPLSLPASA